MGRARAARPRAPALRGRGRCARRAACRRSPTGRSSRPGSPRPTRPRCWSSTCAARRTWSSTWASGACSSGRTRRNVRDARRSRPGSSARWPRPGPRSASAATARRAGSTSRRSSPRAGARSTSAARVHLGVDLFVEPGAVVRAPLAGVVHVLANNREPQDYGPLVILRHEAADGTPFFTLYGHLTEDTLAGLSLGQRVEKGQAIARVGAPPSNGDWPPHLHFQLILDLLEQDADFPGVALPSRRRLFEALSPDPNLLLRIPLDASAAREPPAEETLAARRRLVGPNLRLSYARPLKIVRGFRQYLYDDAGRAYLDVYNNVPLVGHGHPRVVRAAQAAARAPQHQHALPARAAGALRAAAHAPAAGAAARLLLRELGQRGERAGAAARARRDGRPRRDRARARVPRPHHDARGREPVQVPGPGRDGTARVGARGAAAGRLSRTLPARRPAGRAEVRGRGRRDRGPPLRRGPAPGGVPVGDAAERRGPGGVPARLPGRRLPPRAGGRGRRDRRRGADGLRPAGRGVLGLRDAGRRAGHRRPRQADRERLPARRGRDDPRDRRGLRQRHGVLQHLRRQPGRVRGGARGARRARGGEAPGERAARGGRGSRGACASSRAATP